MGRARAVQCRIDDRGSPMFGEGAATALKAAKEVREARERQEALGPTADEQTVAEPDSRQRVARIKELLNAKLRVQITDGRTIYGTLACVDAHANLILVRAEEVKEVGRSRGTAAAMLCNG